MAQLRAARFWKLSAGALASGLGGWAVGTHAAENRVAESQRLAGRRLAADARVAEYVAGLEGRGFAVEDARPSLLMTLHQQHTFTQAVLTRQGRLHPDGPLVLRDAAGEHAFVFHVGAELLDSPASFTAACATMFDESLARTAWARLPSKIGVTGTLELGPVRALPPADGLVVLRARPTTAKGRRSASEGELVSLTANTTLAQASCVMVEPWWGKYIALLT